MPKQWGDLSKEEQDKFQDMDISGEDGGDTGPSGYIDDGGQAEKGDTRRENPKHIGPTRNGPAGNKKQNS
jgi:hypothetical protein